MASSARNTGSSRRRLVDGAEVGSPGDLPLQEVLPAMLTAAQLNPAAARLYVAMVKFRHLSVRLVMKLFVNSVVINCYTYGFCGLL